MKKIEAKIVADSISPQGHRITSMLLTYPRFIHGEVMTHRLFSRNSASSRAIPFEKMVEMVEEDPFIPIAWQKQHKGMQGNEYFGETDTIDWANMSGNVSAKKGLTELWLEASAFAVSCAKGMNRTGLTKQLCNRLLEPFMWHTTLVTATEWENFFELRCPKYEYYLESYGEAPEIREYFRSRKDMITKWGDVYVKDLYQTRPRREVKDFEDIHWLDCNHSQAEIHIQALAESMWDAMNESTPRKLKAGEWHIPFGDKIDLSSFDKPAGAPGSGKIATINIPENYVRIATARCARLSYMTHDGEINYEKDIRLHDQLLNDGHMSPFEHCAMAMDEDEYKTFIRGRADTYQDGDSIAGFSDDSYGWCNNFRGWMQYRYLVENENN